MLNVVLVDSEQGFSALLRSHRPYSRYCNTELGPMSATTQRSRSLGLWRLPWPATRINLNRVRISVTVTVAPTPCATGHRAWGVRLSSAGMPPAAATASRGLSSPFQVSGGAADRRAPQAWPSTLGPQRPQCCGPGTGRLGLAVDSGLGDRQRGEIRRNCMPATPRIQVRLPRQPRALRVF
jgi:hypothetical protein